MSTDEPAPQPGDADLSGAGYAVMLAELEQILGQLEGADVDVDVLAERVARAVALVDACRDRIERARVEVERVVATLADPAAAGGPSEPE